MCNPVYSIDISILSHNSFTDVTAPILGATSVNHLKDLIGVSYWAPRMLMDRLTLDLDAVHLRLDADELKYLEEPYRPQEVFGHA